MPVQDEVPTPQAAVPAPAAPSVVAPQTNDLNDAPLPGNTADAKVRGEARAAAEQGQQRPAPRIQVKWQQINDEVPPLDAMRLYLEGQGLRMDNPEGYQVGRGEDGKLTLGFSLTYDPAQVNPVKVEGVVQGLKELGQGNGLRVFENEEQETVRQRAIAGARPGDVRAEVYALKRELPLSDWNTDATVLESLLSKTVQPAPAPRGVTADEAAPATAAPAATTQTMAAPVVAPPAAVGEAVMPAPAVALTPLVAGEDAPAPASAPVPETGAGELQIKWRQQGDAVAPVLEMRAYLDQLKDLGVAVGPMRFEKGADGKLAGSFGVSYDPQGPGLARLEGTLQGLGRVGNGVEVAEPAEQVAARRLRLGVAGQDQATDLGYSVREAFGAKQWDALSAQLSQAPKQALTGPEQAQQAAGVVRVQQVARQQGRTEEQIIRDGKSLLDIDTSGNPVSAFLKNFYEHLNGAPKARQTLEVDYDKTRQDLQARLGRLAGNAAADDPSRAVIRPEAASPAVAGAGGAATSPGVPAPAVPAVVVPEGPAVAVAPAPVPKFTEADIPQKVLASMGLTVADLAASFQLSALLGGAKTELLPMQAAGKAGEEPVRFDAKMRLRREADGSATLGMELPRRQLVIPNEIGGHHFTREQHEQLLAEGTAGLVRGLKDKAGNAYNGYVGVDRDMNLLVVLPEGRVSVQDEIAGVKLSPEQRHDLREGKAVQLTQMSRPDGGKPFDGTAQINAATAGVEVRPAAHELAQKQAPAARQTREPDPVKQPAPTVAATATEAPTPQVRGPRV